MKIMRIQYTASLAFAETNKKNIATVMSDLRVLNNPDIRYSSYIFEDGKTFMHFVVFKDEEANKALGNLESFKKFQAELKASGLEIPPKVENLTLVGSSYNILD